MTRSTWIWRSTIWIYAGLPNSVNRSRHNQSYKPVLEQSEAVGHAVNCVSLMVSLCDVGVLTGIKEYFDTAQRMWQDAVARKMYITGGVGQYRQRRIWSCLTRCRIYPPIRRRARC